MDFVRWIYSQGSWGIFLACLIGISYLAFGGLNKNEKRRGWWIAKLRHNSFARLYRELLTSLLDRIDRALSPAPEWPDAKGLPKTEPGRAWSHQLLSFCLLLAIAYPILGFMLDWTITGDTGRLGSFIVLEPMHEQWRRLIPTAVLFATLAVALATRQSRSSQTRPDYRLIAIGVMLALAVAPGLELSITHAFILACVVGLTLALGATPEVVVIFALPYAVSNGVAYTLEFGPDVAFLIAAMLAIASAFALLGLHKLSGSYAPFLVAYVLLLLVALGATSHFTAQDIGADERSALLFLGFLPLLNGLFDYLSTGLTRWRLRCGIQGHLIRNAVIDALAGYAILLLLAFAIIMTIRLATPPGAPPLLNLDEILTDFREGRANEYYWLIGMLFSTLLPTLVHLCIGCFAAFTIVSGKLGRPIATGLAAGEGPAGNMAALALSACAALAVWVPCYVLWHLVMMGHEPVLRFTLHICESFARGIGSI